MEYIKHHGILGQKWGIRRYQNKDGTLTSEGRRHKREKPASEMSDKELDARLSRLRKEKEYNDLSNKAQNEGKKKVMDVLKDTGTVVGLLSATGGLVLTAKKLIDTFSGEKTTKGIYGDPREYSQEQKKQDERLYGPAAAKRIEKRILEDGETVISARHKEVIAKQQRENAKNVARRVAKPVKDLAITAIGTAGLLTVATVAKKAINGEKIDIKTLPSDVVKTGKNAINGVLSSFGI